MTGRSGIKGRGSGQETGTTCFRRVSALATMCLEIQEVCDAGPRFILCDRLPVAMRMTSACIDSECLRLVEQGRSAQPHTGTHGNRESHDTESTKQVECDLEKGYLLTVFQMLIISIKHNTAASSTNTECISIATSPHLLFVNDLVLCNWSTSSLISFALSPLCPTCQVRRHWCYRRERHIWTIRCSHACARSTQHVATPLEISRLCDETR